MISDRRSKVLPLVSLRGLFCIAIALFHSNVRIVFEQLAGCGVVFFFVMSGFFMALQHPAISIEERYHKRYFLPKALRLYAIHWLALLLLLVIHFLFNTYDPHITWKAIVPNVLLLQSYFPDKEIFFSFNSVSWFLCSILCCYFCYPFLAHALKSMRLKYRILLMLALMVLYGVALYPIGSEDVITYTHVCPLLRLYEFALGIVLGDLYHKLNGKMQEMSAASATLIEAAPLALLALLVAVDLLHRDIFRSNYNDSYLWEIPSALIILAFMLTAGGKGLIGRALSWKPLVWLGGLSLELFLFQAIAGLVYNYVVSPVFGHFGMNIYPYYPIGLLPILVVLAWVVNRYFTTRVAAIISVAR